jgi:type VI secretion system secreted protein Hcp
MAVQMFLHTETPTISGESIEASHQKWISVVSFEWGESRSGARPGTSIDDDAKPKFSSLKIVKFVDSASPQFMAACAKETKFGEWEFHVQSRGERPACFYGLRLRECMISSTNTHFEDPYLVEEIGVIFMRIEMEYAQIGADGAVVKRILRGYDVQLDKTYEPGPFLGGHA